MKQVFFGLMTAGLVTGSAFAAPAATLETLNVKNVELHGDFMPPLPPGSSHLPSARLTVQVTSNGCTEASSFRVETVPVAGGKQLRILRVRPDHCRAYFPEGTEVDLTVRDVGFTDKLFIVNPALIIDKTTH